MDRWAKIRLLMMAVMLTLLVASAMGIVPAIAGDEIPGPEPII